MVTIEVDGPQCESLYFRPLGKVIRGHFDLMKDKDPQAMAAAATKPNPIPGQRLSYDESTGTATIVEPLQTAEHTVLKEAIEKRGLKLPPARETVEYKDSVTFLHWMKRAVESGIAKLVEGRFPKLQGKPQTSFVVPERKDERLELAEAIQQQTSVFAEILKVLKDKQ